MVDVCMQTTDVCKSEMKAHDAEVIQYIKTVWCASQLSTLMLSCDGIVISAAD